MTSPFKPEASRYAISRAVARRARMLWAGAPTSRHPCRAALAEQRAGLLPFRIVPPSERKLFLVQPSSQSGATEPEAA